MLRALLALLLAVAPYAAHADGSVGFMYSRNDIAILRNKLPQPLPWQTETPPDPAVTFDVEVRDASAFYTPMGERRRSGWYNLNSLGDKNGVMIAFAAPLVVPVTRSQEFAPVDILFIDAHGIIRHIVPNVVLSELDRDIVPENPVMALLFLQGGAAARNMVSQNDSVDYKLFHKSPVIIGGGEPARVKREPDPSPPYDGVR